MPHKGPIPNPPIWKILKAIIGKDPGRVSLPCILNEPVNGMQREAENYILGEGMINRAAIETDPVKRIALVICATMTGMQSSQVRKKKPFNPMLGETYELVTDRFRFVAEKV